MLLLFLGRYFSSFLAAAARTPSALSRHPVVYSEVGGTSVPLVAEALGRGCGAGQQREPERESTDGADGALPLSAVLMSNAG